MNRVGSDHDGIEGRAAGPEAAGARVAPESPRGAHSNSSAQHLLSLFRAEPGKDKMFFFVSGWFPCVQTISNPEREKQHFGFDS